MSLHISVYLSEQRSCSVIRSDGRRITDPNDDRKSRLNDLVDTPFVLPCKGFRHVLPSDTLGRSKIKRWDRHSLDISQINILEHGIEWVCVRRLKYGSWLNFVTFIDWYRYWQMKIENHCDRDFYGYDCHIQILHIYDVMWLQNHKRYIILKLNRAYHDGTRNYHIEIRITHIKWHEWTLINLFQTYWYFLASPKIRKKQDVLSCDDPYIIASFSYSRVRNSI